MGYEKYPARHKLIKLIKLIKLKIPFHGLHHCRQHPFTPGK